MDPTGLAPRAPEEWLHAVLGAVLFLMPGLAAADRLLPHVQVRWALAPVFSATLYSLTAILLGAVGVPVRPVTTSLIGLAWATLLFQRRAARWLASRVAA